MVSINLAVVAQLFCVKTEGYLRPALHFSKEFVLVHSQQVEEIQRQLEGERKKNKDLSSTLVRLNGIIKTGQDALTQEQKLVKQLQEQLTEKTKVSHSV